jgi:hypothetical protein
MNAVNSREFQHALRNLTHAIHPVEAMLEAMRAEHDPLASHIFVSRRQYQNRSDTKSGKRGAVSARLSWQTACDLGFRGDLDEWERLMEAVPAIVPNDLSSLLNP